MRDAETACVQYMRNTTDVQIRWVYLPGEALRCNHGMDHLKMAIRYISVANVMTPIELGERSLVEKVSERLRKQ